MAQLMALDAGLGQKRHSSMPLATSASESIRAAMSAFTPVSSTSLSARERVVKTKAHA